jgi:hypothetical protein
VRDGPRETACMHACCMELFSSFSAVLPALAPSSRIAIVV